MCYCYIMTKHIIKLTKSSRYSYSVVVPKEIIERALDTVRNLNATHFSEEELQYLIDRTKDPKWLAIQEKTASLQPVVDKEMFGMSVQIANIVRDKINNLILKFFGKFFIFFKLISRVFL